MLRAALTAMLLTACIDHGESPQPDGPGSNAAAGDMDPSPPDIALELIVVGLSAVVVIGPIRARRRERNNQL